MEAAGKTWLVSSACCPPVRSRARPGAALQARARSEIKRFRGFFDKMDSDGSGQVRRVLYTAAAATAVHPRSSNCNCVHAAVQVDVAEFFEFIKVERNLLCDSIIHMLDEDGSGQLEFCAISGCRILSSEPHDVHTLVSLMHLHTAEFLTAVGTYCLFGMEEITKFVYSVIMDTQGTEKVRNSGWIFVRCFCTLKIRSLLPCSRHTAYR